MNTIYASEQRFWGENDSQTIQNAVNYAAETGLGKVVIPRFNERTGKALWDLPEAVLLPSDMTIILDGCHLRHADDSHDNLFRNSNMWTDEGKTLEGEQHDIRIIGQGNAWIDGGKHNGVFEQTHRDNPGKYRGMIWQIPLNFSNVRNMEIRGIKFFETRYWALCFHYCRWVMLSDLHFENSGLYENQDGIDLRCGCEYFTIQNITGWTGDDVVALTAMAWGNSAALKVEGKTWDTHDVTIKNIIASSHGCGIIRFLVEGGAREYNLTVDGIKDITQSVSGTAILMGTSDNHFADPPHRMPDFKNVVIRNITTCSQRALSIAETCRDVLIENVTTYGPNEVGLRFYENFECENMTIRNVTLRSQKGYLDSAFWMQVNPNRTLKNLRVENVVVACAPKYMFRGTEFPVDGLLHDQEPTEGWFTPETTRLSRAYGRYHYMSYGTVIKERPVDNRYDGTLKTPEELAAE